MFTCTNFLNQAKNLRDCEKSESTVYMEAKLDNLIMTCAYMDRALIR